MKVAFNIQNLISGNKYGIGHSQDACMKTLIARHLSDKFFLELFLYKDFFDFFSRKNTESKLQKARFYCRENVALNICASLPSAAYRVISALVPLPYRWFIKTEADITHFFNFTIPPFVKGKKVVTIHDMAFRRFPETVRMKTKWMLRLNIRKTIKRADRIVAVSEFAKKEILEFYNYPAEKIKVVYNGVDTALYNTKITPERIAETRKNFGILQDYILYVGTLEPRKNLERLIRAYDLAKKRRADFPILVLAGAKGWLFDGIFQTVKNLRLEESVFFTGYVPDKEKPALMAGSRCFCFPSLYEGFGMPVLEAMACGTPVMTADNSSLPEVAGDAALFVNAFSVEEIAAAIEKLCFDETARMELREKGLERVKLFSWDKSADILHTIYKEVVEE